MWSRIAAGSFLALVALSGCAGAPAPLPPPAAQTFAPTSPTWTLTLGSWVEVQIYRGKGTFDPATGYITIDPMTLVAGEINRTTMLPYQMAEGPAAARVYSPGGVTVTEVAPDLSGTLVERSNGYFLGEAANAGARDQNPPEPLLSAQPFPGESFGVTSTITWASGAAPSPFQTWYRTISVDTDVDGFQNCTVTTLVENPGKSGQMWAYVNVFDGGTDMAEQWAGLVQADNSVDVILGRRVRVGINA